MGFLSPLWLLLGAAVAVFRFILGFARGGYDFRWLVIWTVWAALGLFVLLAPAAFGLSFSELPYIVSGLASGVWAMLAGYACLCAGVGILAVNAQR